MKKISTVLTLFALMLTLSACGGRDSVADAKGTMFDSINAAATLGEMVDVVICNAQWSSEKVSDNLYNVTVTGTIQNDIPDFRSHSGEYFCAVLSVQYYNDQYQAMVTDGYFGSASTYDPISYLSAAYKVAAGITSENQLMDANKETSNEALPLFTIQLERRGNRSYSLSRTSRQGEFFNFSDGTYYWLREIVDAPNRVGYTLNSIALDLYQSNFSDLDIEKMDIVLELFNAGTEELSPNVNSSVPDQDEYSAGSLDDTNIYDYSPECPTDEEGWANWANSMMKDYGLPLGSDSPLDRMFYYLSEEGTSDLSPIEVEAVELLKLEHPEYDTFMLWIEANM